MYAFMSQISLELVALHHSPELNSTDDVGKIGETSDSELPMNIYLASISALRSKWNG